MIRFGREFFRRATVAYQQEMEKATAELTVEFQRIALRHDNNDVSRLGFSSSRSRFCPVMISLYGEPSHQKPNPRTAE